MFLLGEIVTSVTISSQPPEKKQQEKKMIKQNLKQYKARMRPRTTKYKELFPTKCYTGLI